MGFMVNKAYTLQAARGALKGTAQGAERGKKRRHRLERLRDAGARLRELKA